MDVTFITCITTAANILDLNSKRVQEKIVWGFPYILEISSYSKVRVIGK